MAKAATKKAVKKTEKPIKYADKSEGQPELAPIFQRIKTMLSKYHGKGTLEERGADSGGQYTIISFKDIEVAGRKLDSIYFASTLVQKGFVGFYFFPIYACKEAIPFVEPELKKCLKGKTCFHIKKNDEIIMQQIEEALQKGFQLYKKLGWV